MLDVETMPDAPPDTGLGERTPPHDIDAEQALLGAMLVSAEAIAVVSESGVTGEMFYRPPHETIFDACMHLYGHGESVDAFGIVERLRQIGELARVGGAPYLHTLTQRVTATVSVPGLCANVREKKARRDIITAAMQAMQQAYSGENEADKIADRAQEALIAAVRGTKDTDYRPIGDLLQPTLDEVEAIAAHDGSMRGVPTGFTDLDSYLNGLQPGQLVVVAARPAIGKSTLALDMARHAAVQFDKTVAFFSLEMSATDITMRMLSAEGKVELHRMRSGSLTDQDWERIARVTTPMGQAPLLVDDSPNMTIPQIRAKARRIKQNHGLSLIVVDYLQLMSSGQRVESRQNEVSEFSRSLKLLAKELEVPVVALSQLNRGPEQRADKKPLLSDLRESGAIEQDADVVILLHREDAHDEDTPRRGEADFIIAKHRNGPTGTVAVAFQGHFSRFHDMAHL